MKHSPELFVFFTSFPPCSQKHFPEYFYGKCLPLASPGPLCDLDLLPGLLDVVGHHLVPAEGGLLLQELHRPLGPVDVAKVQLAVGQEVVQEGSGGGNVEKKIILLRGEM